MVKDLHPWGGIFARVSNSLGKMPPPLNNECGTKPNIGMHFKPCGNLLVPFGIWSGRLA